MKRVKREKEAYQKGSFISDDIGTIWQLWKLHRGAQAKQEKINGEDVSLIQTVQAQSHNRVISTGDSCSVRTPFRI